jgi:propanol-preferring alcohol dehydrogenase
VVGRVEGWGSGVAGVALGQRLGLTWLGGCCGACPRCLEGRENLCPSARFTGLHYDGGYADYCVADRRFCFDLPPAYDDAAAAPLLCGGVIGYRAYKLAGPGRRLGLYGFGSAGHLLVQVAAREGREVHVFTRPGDQATQAFARDLGAAWAGGSLDSPPQPLDAAILFAADGSLVPLALQAVAPGGRVVCAGIHMSGIPAFPYSLLWGERSLSSVANLTRADAEGFLALAGTLPVRPVVRRYRLEDADAALRDLKAGAYRGSGVLLTGA